MLQAKFFKDNKVARKMLEEKTSKILPVF